MRHATPEMLSFGAAPQIAHMRLDLAADGINAKCFQTFLDRVWLPFEVRTHSMHRVVTTPEDFFVIDDGMDRMLTMPSVTDDTRVARDKEVVSDNEMIAPVYPDWNARPVTGGVS